MITEAIFRAFWHVVNFIDFLIPPIPWPDFLFDAYSWVSGVIVKSDVVGIFGFIHPVTYDVIALSFVLRGIKVMVNRTRQAISLATGGGLS